MALYRWQIIVFVLFLISRLFIVTHPAYVGPDPNDWEKDDGFSDVVAYYEPYAKLWVNEGLTPYFKHLYEYPPATIPLLWLPLWLDQHGIGHYYDTYRWFMFGLECGFFLFLFKAITTLKTSRHHQYVSLGFYIIAGLIARNFWYEGIDLVFITTYTMALIWSYLYQPTLKQRIMTWIFFWLSTSIKLMTAPLSLLLGLVNLKQWRLEWKAMVAGGLIIWAFPVLYFRSSLSVMLLFHLSRPLKYGAFGTWIIELVNDFTRSETRVTEPPDFQWVGPVSTQVLTAFKLAFPIVVLLVLGYAGYYLYQQVKSKPLKPPQTLAHLIRLSLLYFFAIFLTGKTFSAPFHIWYVPLIALYPFKTRRWQLTLMALALWMLVIDTTPWMAIPSSIPFIDPVPLVRVRDFLRFVPMLVSIIFLVRLDTQDKTSASA